MLPILDTLYEQHLKSPQSCWNKVLEKKKAMGSSKWPRTIPTASPRDLGYPRIKVLGARYRDYTDAR